MSKDQFKHMHHGLVSAFHIGDFEVVVDGSASVAGTGIALELKYYVRLVRQTTDTKIRTMEADLIWL